MLGAADTKVGAEEVLARVESLAEGIAYVAPEMADQRRMEILSAIRREIREWRRA